MVEKEVEVGQMKGLFQEIVQVTEAEVVVDQCQDQEQVQIGTELDVTSVGDMIIL